MPRFSSQSLEKLGTCKGQLEALFRRVVKTYDCSVLQGHRGEAAQNEAFRAGLSKLEFPRSKHNRDLSEAVDAAPYPINWTQTKRFYHFGGYVLGVASEMDIPIRWGGDWDQDHDLYDQTFMDLVHFELEED